MFKEKIFREFSSLKDSNKLSIFKSNFLVKETEIILFRELISIITKILKSFIKFIKPYLLFLSNRFNNVIFEKKL